MRYTAEQARKDTEAALKQEEVYKEWLEHQLSEFCRRVALRASAGQWDIHFDLSHENLKYRQKLIEEIHNLGYAWATGDHKRYLITWKKEGFDM